MDSLDRPPHRRKHSITTNASSSSSSSFCLRNPYDDVLLSKGGKTKFEAHEYTEIFSGSSCIPVLDISGLNERVGPADSRSSKLDYSNIFGGLREDDVAVPYEQLFSGALKKTKTRIPADVESPFHEPGSVNSSVKTKRSSGASDHSNDGIKQQINMSFSRTSQRNSDKCNAKIHIAQLHAVPGFTHFVDETPPLEKNECEKPARSMKHEVSHSWSFSSGVESIAVKGGIASEKSHIPDKSCNVNGINLKSHISKAPPPSSNPSNPNDNKDLRHSRLPSFASKDDSKETPGEYLPPFLEEELDENSVAAVSAAALKKAIEQAEESIRIAKMIMEKRKEGLKDGSKTRSKSHSKLKDKKETRIHHVPDALKEKNVRVTHEKLDPTVPTFTGVYGKFVPSLSHSDSCLNAWKANVETVRENVEAANDHRDAFTEVGKKFAPSCSENEILDTKIKFEMENVKPNVESGKACGETTNFIALVANAKYRAATLESGKVDNIDSSTCSANKEPCMEQLETDKETLGQSELTVHLSKGPEIVSEMEESAPNSSQCVVEALESIVKRFEEPESIAKRLERVLNCSEREQEQEKIMHEGGGNLRISLTESDGVADDKDKCQKKFVEHEELICVDKLTVVKLEFDNLPNGLSLVEKDVMEQASLDEKSENVSEWKENDQDGKSDEEESGMVVQEEHQWFESELKLTEPVEEEISRTEPEIYQEVEVGIKLNVVNELEIVDKKLNSEHDKDEQNLPGEDGWNKIADRRWDNCEYEAAENLQMETDFCSKVQKSESPWDAGEINDTHIGARRSEENRDKFKFQEVAPGKDVDEVIDAHCSDSGTIFRCSHRDNTSTIFSETQEPCDVDLNHRAEEYQAADRGCKENDSLPLETETLYEVEDNGVGKTIHLGVKMPRTDSLPRCVSAEKFIECQPNSTFKGLSSDSNCVNVDITDADHEVTLPKDEEMTASDIHNAAEQYAAKISRINLPDFHTNDDKIPEFDSTNVKPVLAQTSESHEEYLLTSVLENIDEVSTHDSQSCTENLKDNISNKEEGNDRLREDVGEQVERLLSKDQSGDMSSQSHCGPKEMGKSTEAERKLETGQNIEKNEENPSRISTVGQKDAKGNDQKFEANNYQQRIDAIKRGREREKDRIAVERAIREARERAFAEARERVERAAVERAAAEARQRIMAEAREKLEKASVENKQSADNASNEAKLRAERAAVERATAEARERALEKAMSQKTCTEARTQAEKYSTERFSSSSRNNGLKHSFSSSDLEKFDGAASESAQRCKARLERHQRIMERAAKALAEKNMRDVLAQKEQAERNRLAESLDADIKRWATGKDGNLRALLSTLQYILGADSGWKPISLTDIITTAAVKKAYRKATLCVHPDKLQQRGATIQQKYICEKVFDLLKAAWNRFNSEER